MITMHGLCFRLDISVSPFLKPLRHARHSRLPLDLTVAQFKGNISQEPNWVFDVPGLSSSYFRLRSDRRTGRLQTRDQTSACTCSVLWLPCVSCHPARTLEVFVQGAVLHLPHGLLRSAARGWSREAGSQSGSGSTGREPGH